MKSIVVLLTLFSLYEGLYASSAGCPKGWTRLRGIDRCFYMSLQADTFPTGKNFCESNNAQLVPPLICDEHIDLRKLLLTLRGKCRKGGDRHCDEYWIGIEKLNASHWTTPKGFLIDNDRQCQQWAKGFPNDNEGNCVIISLKGYRSRGVWRNIDCNQKFKFVCITCPNHFDYIPEINECLRFYNVRVTWQVAQKNCAKVKRRARLLTIQSEAKQEVVKRYLTNKFGKPDSSACDVIKYPALGRIVWICAQTKDPKKCNSPYIWKPFGAGAMPLLYTNFFPGVPNCGYKDENCLGVANSPLYDHQWDDLPCSDMFCYVCEY